MKLNSYLLLFLMFCASCVGTIEESTQEFTQGEDVLSNPDFMFLGADALVSKPIAHDKVLLRFMPAQGGSGIFSYRVYVDSNFATPAAASSSVQLQTTPTGHNEVVVKNLTKSRTYTFIVRAFDMLSGKEDNNILEFTTTTFNQFVPDFDGVESVENLSGIDGTRGFKLNWFKAESPIDDPFGVSLDAVKGYNVYYSTNAYDLTHSSISPIVVNDANATETIITGLNSDTIYYFMIRAFSKRGEEDKNERLKDGTTLSASLDFEFDGISDVVSDPLDCSGSFATVNWELGTGPFDKYKVLYATSEASMLGVDPLNPSATGVTELVLDDLSKDNLRVSGLTKGITYYFAVAACNNTQCVGHTNVESITLEPQIIAFNGLNNITKVGAKDYKLNFNIPSVGCYDDIKVYFHDNYPAASSYTEVADTFQANDMYIDPNNDGTTTESKVITNLEYGNRYCFSVTATLGTEETSIESKVECRDLTPPIFSMDLTSCEKDASTARITCDWLYPGEIVGQPYDQDDLSLFNSVFTNYVFVWAVGNSIDWNEITCNLSGCSSTNTAKYSFSIPLDTTQKSYTITSSLQPSTDYSFGVIAISNESAVPSLQVASTPSFILTDALGAEHQGIYHIMALGPKIRHNQPVLEKIKFDSNGNIYPEIDLTATGGSSGMVALVWNDFKMSDGTDFYDYYQNLTGDTSNYGYKVFRMPASKGQSTPDYTDSRWAEVSGYVEPLLRSGVETPNGNQNLKYARFVDYTANTGDGPANIPMLGDLTRSYTVTDNRNYGRAYWYKVELFLNGAKLNLNGDLSQIKKHTIPKIIVPPNNMALVHPWMANKEMCEIMGKTPDEENNFRCEYDGFGHIQDGAQKYYDINGYMFVDRFEMGANYSRGVCQETALTDATKFYGHSTFNRNPTDPAATDALVGDCVGVLPPDNLNIEAPKDTIYVDHPSGEPWIQTAGDAVTLGSAWTRIDFSSGPDLWGKAYENQASLPVISYSYQNIFNGACQAHDVKIKYDNSQESTLSYPKKLISRKEQIAASRFGPLINSSTMDGVIGGQSPGQCNSDEVYGQFDSYMNRPLQNYIDGDLRIYNSSFFFNEPLNIQYHKFVRSNNNAFALKLGATSSTARLVSGSTESISDFKSFDSRQCVTAYGIQDMYGNQEEYLRDILFCYEDSSDDGKYCSFGHRNIKVGGNDFTDAIDGNTDWIDGDGEYLNLAPINKLQDLDSSFTKPVYGAVANRGGGSIERYMHNTLNGYFNAPMGWPLADTAQGDNKKISVQSSLDPETARTFFNYQFLSNQYQFNFSLDSSYILPLSGSRTSTNVGITYGGNTENQSRYGRWGYFAGYHETRREYNTTGRCSVVMPYND